MEQFLLHTIGDYITQNNWMALNKTKNTLKGYLACFIHATLYSLPFLLIGSFNAFLVIYITHFFIDKYRLAVYWTKFVNWNWKSKTFGYTEDTPIWLYSWLLYIVDNIFHLSINYLSLKYL